MTPKEKAEELINKFYNVETHEVDYGGGGCTCPAKEYAIICCEENMKFRDYYGTKYWEQVKEEINKL